MRQRPVPEALTEEQRARAIEHVRRLGDRLRQEGYKGFFEVDVLVDLDADEVYLGELNPRISGRVVDDQRDRRRLRRRARCSCSTCWSSWTSTTTSTSMRSTSAGASWRRSTCGPADHEGHRQELRADPGSAAHRTWHLSRTTDRLRHVSATPTTGTTSRTRTSASSCASTARATTASRAPTWASSSPRAGCRPPEGSPSAAAGTSTASAPSTKPHQST